MSQIEKAAGMPGDAFSYACGVMDCFNEMLRAGLKRLAMAHPSPTRAERDALLPYARLLCTKYGTHCYCEDTPLLTDLFPLSLNQGTYNLLFYAGDEVLEEYLELKAEKGRLVRDESYFGERRRGVAYQFGRLLSYSDEAIGELIERNTDREPQTGGRASGTVGVLLLAHGSREKTASNTMQTLIKTAQKYSKVEHMECAFLQFHENTLKVGLERLAQCGVTQIKVIPCFLSEGVHIRVGVPKEIAEFCAAHPQVSVRLGRTLGADERLGLIVADRIREML